MTLTYSDLMTAKPDDYLEAAGQLSLAVMAVAGAETSLYDQVLTPMTGGDSWSGPAHGDAIRCTSEHVDAMGWTRQELANAAKAFTLLAGDLSEAQLRMAKATTDAEANGVSVSADGTAISAPQVANPNPGTSTAVIIDEQAYNAALIAADLAKGDFETTRDAILEYVSELDEGCSRLLDRIDPSQLTVPTNVPHSEGSPPPSPPVDLYYLNNVFKTDVRVGRDDAETTDPVVDVLSQVESQLDDRMGNVSYVDKLNQVLKDADLVDNLPTHTAETLDNFSATVDSPAFKATDKVVNVAGVGLTLTSYLHEGDDWIDALGKTAVEETSAWAGTATGAKTGAGICTAAGQPELAPLCAVPGGIAGGILGSEVGKRIIRWLDPDDDLDPMHSFLIELEDNREELAEYNSELTVENAVDAFIHAGDGLSLPTPHNSTAEVYEQAARESESATDDEVRRGVTIGAEATRPTRQVPKGADVPV